MADVAARAGVSHQTVSRVLNDHPSVRDETRARVLAVISELGYRRNVAARALVTARSSTVGVVTPGSGLYGPASTVIAIEEAARERGYFTSVATLSSYDAPTMRRVLDHFMDQAVEGILVVAPQSAVAEAVDQFQAPVPVILVAAREQVEGVSTIPVSVDQRLGARLAVNHLLGLGHRTVEHVSGPLDWFDAVERLTGWREALLAHGAPVPEPIPASWSASDGYTIGLRLAEQVRSGSGPTAVFAGNDQLALGMLRAFWEQGVVVPRDVSVVGFDDVDGAAHFIPPLSTVRQPFAALGGHALGLLLTAVDGGVLVPARIEPELVLRASTGVPRPR
ncbi:LacI family transcriptional regulator [Xylanimonas protaetiae]|uniref:LacI family transcriptional regulator n=2 Tax=Xylanimonas protaetiae TaxID=2509457 RepID=A0A4P6F7T2_9MICO|nr:LacI family transcriptional regulator [Xylanimonas protaetiae]